MKIVKVNVMSQSLWVRDRFLIVRGAFSPCFQCVAEGVSNFCFCEKVGASAVVFIRVFHGVFGVALLADSARILLYLVGFFYAGTFFLFFCGWFWKGATGSRCLPGFWGGIRSRGLQRGGGSLAGRLRFCSSGRVLARGVRIGRGWRGRGRCCFVAGWLLRRGVCGFFVGAWALLCRRR